MSEKAPLVILARLSGYWELAALLLYLLCCVCCMNIMETQEANTNCEKMAKWPVLARLLSFRGVATASFNSKTFRCVSVFCRFKVLHSPYLVLFHPFFILPRATM